MRALVFAAMAAFGLATIPASGALEVAAVAQVEFYQEGNRLYQEGEFEDALASYLRLVEAGFESGEVYYNIGNAFFKLGDLAQSILYYERARRLLPGDEDVQVNLELARSLTVDEIEPLPRFWLFAVVAWWVDLLPRTVLIAVVTASYLVGTGVVLLLILKGGVTVAGWGRRIALASGIVFLLLGLNLAIRELEVGRAQEAVVLQPEVDVKSAPLDGETLTVFTVHGVGPRRIARASGIVFLLLGLNLAIRELEVGRAQEAVVLRVLRQSPVAHLTVPEARGRRDLRPEPRLSTARPSRSSPCTKVPRFGSIASPRNGRRSCWRIGRTTPGRKFRIVVSSGPRWGCWRRSRAGVVRFSGS